MQTDTSYSFAPGMFGRERTFQLGPEALRWDAGKGGGGSLAYADVDTLHIFRLYRPYGLGMQVCVVRTRSGAKCVLKSKNVRSFGRTDDRAGSYVPFVRDLIGRVAAAAPQARFFDGLPGGWYATQLVSFVLCAILILAALVPAVAGSGTDKSDASVTLFLAVILFAPPMFAASKTLLRGRPRPFDPRRLDGDLAGLRLAPQA